MESLKWVRSENGAIFGVCKGVAEGMGWSVGWTRLLLIAAILFFGVGFGAYILLAISLPRRDRLDNAYKSRVLGVCAHIAKKSNIEVGLVRLAALLLLIFSFGTTILLYVIAYMLLPDAKSSDSLNKPSVPPSTT